MVLFSDERLIMGGGGRALVGGAMRLGATAPRKIAFKNCPNLPTVTQITPITRLTSALPITIIPRAMPNPLTSAQLEARKTIGSATARAALTAHGGRLEASNPDKVSRILLLVAQGQPISHIARETDTSATTIARLKRDHLAALSLSRQAHASEVASVSDATLELLKEKINHLAQSPELLNDMDAATLTKIWSSLEDRRQGLDHQLPTTDDDTSMTPEEAQEEINRLSRIKDKGVISVDPEPTDS